MTHVSKLIKVTVNAQYLPEQSFPESNQYVFAYHVHIANNSDQPVQLMSRHWIITDGNQEVKEVKGDGVIGAQPLIHPNKNYAYQSGSILETPVGTMQGSYTMSLQDGTNFEAEIPIFQLAQPLAVH